MITGSTTLPALLLFLAAASATISYDAYNDYAVEDNTPQLDYKDPHWCHSPHLTNGEVTCHSPQGRAYRSTLGTRCEMSCDRGYRLLGRRSIQCLANRRWSGDRVLPHPKHCRQMRCHVLPLIPYGRYSCTQGFVVDSRCDFTCDPGYRIDGEHSRTCQHGSTWSGVQPVCSDTEPPKIKCPLSRIKYAEPGKLTARVTWDPPTATDTADKHLEYWGPSPGTDFNEGANIIRYKVYDQARNRAACKFIIRVEGCPELHPPVHGYVTCSSDGNNYGATCDYHCDGGYERRGVSSRVCQYERDWSGDPAECVSMEIKADVKTASALLDQFYEKRRLLIVSAPNITDPDYQMQNIMTQKSECGLDQRHVTVIELLGSPPRETGRIKEKQLSAEAMEELRQMFKISRSYFSMVLLDRLGVDRERFITPMSSDELFAFIDSFLLDEQERERLELHQDFCD
ncbi:LOW QUALITY PROTEIN: sushi repeat-containing protein SRPX2-like [Lampetra planeri]